MSSTPFPRVVAATGGLLLFAALLTSPVALGAAGETEWRMDGCVGLAALALAPREAVQAHLPAGFRAEDAAGFLLPGAPDPSGILGNPVPGEQGLLGVEVWKCESITLGGVTTGPVTYGSIAAVIEPPAGSGSASLYFYKYENWFSSQSLVQQSTRLGAPTKLAVASDVAETDAGASGSITLATGETYALTTTKLGTMGPGSFLEWHKGDKGMSEWHASFTVSPGHQGSATLSVPPGGVGARILGSPGGSGLGIATHSTFTGGAALR